MEPWDLTRDFVQMMANQQANNENAGDTALMKIFGNAVGRKDMNITQGYNLDTLAKRNEYATEADTTAYGRQVERDNSAFRHQDDRALRDRKWATEDDTRDFGQSKELARYNQQMLAEREGFARGGAGTGDPYIDATIGRESGGKANAQNPNSTAGGLGQITDGTWAGLVRKYGREYGLTPDGKMNPDQNVTALRLLTKDNEAVLAQNGIPITNGNKYAAHFLGAAGATSVLRSPDGDLVSQHIGADQLHANQFLKGMTVGQFKQWTASKYSGAGGEGPIDVPNGPQRRYAGEGQPEDYGDTILRNPTPNSGGDVASIPQDTVQMMADQGLEVTDRKHFNQVQLESLATNFPDIFKNIVADPLHPYDGKNPMYLVTRQRPSETQANADATAPDGTSKTIQGPQVPLQKQGVRGRYVDGKLQLEDIQLPD